MVSEARLFGGGELVRMRNEEDVGELVRMRSRRRRRGAVARGRLPPWSLRRGCSEVGELVRMRNEEDGRHGLRGCSEVGELEPPGTNRSRRLAKEGRRGPKGRRRPSTPGNQSQPKAVRR